MVVPPGFEPGLRVSKTPVRPLHHGTDELCVLYQKACSVRTVQVFLEFHDFSIAHARNRPDTADVAPLLALQAFNLRSPIERPTSSFSISRAIRRRVAGAPARSRHSSLRSHAENKIPPSAIPLGKTSGCSPSASYACKLSFLTRRTPASPRLKRLMRTDAKTLSVSPSDRV